MARSTLQTLHRIKFGDPFSMVSDGEFQSLGTCGTERVEQCLRLANAIRSLSAKLFGVAPESFSVDFGVHKHEHGMARYCVRVSAETSVSAANEKRENLETAVKAFGERISGSKIGDLFTETEDQSAMSLGRAVAEDFLRTDGGTTFTQNVRLECGKITFNVPSRLAAKPTRNPIHEEFSVVGYVDVVGRSDREMGILKEGRKKTRCNFDVAAHMPRACELLNSHRLCRFDVERDIDADGKETIKIVGIASQQGDLFLGDAELHRSN